MYKKDFGKCKKLERLLNTYHCYKYGGLWNEFLIYFGLKDLNLL